MTNKHKRSVRERMKKTGESYQAAHNALTRRKAEESVPVPSVTPVPVQHSEAAAQPPENVGEPHQNEGSLSARASDTEETMPDVHREQSRSTSARRPKGSWREISPGEWAHDQHSVTIRAGTITEIRRGREETYEGWEVFTTKPFWVYRRLADAKRAATNLGRWYS